MQNQNPNATAHSNERRPTSSKRTQSKAQAEVREEVGPDHVGEEASETDIADKGRGAYNRATSVMGKKLTRAGHSLEKSQFIERAGKSIAKMGAKLEATSAQTMLSDLRTVVRERPLLAVGVGVVVGMLVARRMR